MNVLNGLNRVIGGLAGLSLAVMTVLVLLQILFRYCLEIPFPESQELAIIAMVYVTMLGSVLAVRNKTHVAVNFLVDRFPPRIAGVLRICTYVITVIFFVLLLKESWALMLRAMTQKSTATGIPTGYIVASIPLASAMSILYLCEHLVKAIRQLGKLKDTEEGENHG